jgi:hypothetical protein
MQPNLKNTIKQFLFILGGAFCFMVAALYNKYPIVFSDTGTYIYSGFSLLFPIDRPITYGIFIRILSLSGKTLWIPIFAQSLILSYMVFLTIKMVLGESFNYVIVAILFIFLSLFTSASWVSSMVMADVFTPIGILSGTIILFGNVKRSILLILYVIFFLAAATHFSHILIFSLLFAIVVVCKKWILPARLYPKRYFRAIALVSATLGSIFIMRPSLNSGKYIMFFSTMLSQGIAQEYMKEYCGEKHYKLCEYKDSLEAKNGEATFFEYDPKSPLTKLGGWTDSMRDECTDITYGTLTKPKYIWLHILASLRCSFIQLYSFKTGAGNGPYMDEFPVLVNIRKHFSNELSQYCNSRQNKDIMFVFNGTWYGGVWNNILNTFIVLGLFILVLVFILKRSVFNGTFGYVTTMLIMGIILNAWDCGTFSDINLRYGSRVMWFIPFLASLAIVLFFRKKASIKFII